MLEGTIFVPFFRLKKIIDYEIDNIEYILF